MQLTAKSPNYKKIAILVGILFIIATAASSVSVILTTPIFESTDYLNKLSNNPNRITLAGLLMLIDAIAVAAIAITIHPVLRKYGNTWAHSYVGARLVESVFFILYAITLLALMTFGVEFATAKDIEASHLQAIGSSIRAIMDWTFTIGYGIVFTLSALILNYILYKSRLVPRWLSVWGFIGGTISMGMNLLSFYNILLPQNLDFVIAMQEMVFAIWLIIKGFNPSTIDYKTALTQDVS